MTIVAKPFKPRMRFNIYGMWLCWGKGTIAVSHSGVEAYEHWKTRAALIAAGHGVEIAAPGCVTATGSLADGSDQFGRTWARVLRPITTQNENRA